MAADLFDGGTVGVLGCPLGNGFVGTADHGFRSDEDQVEPGAWEQVSELVPDFAGEAGLGSGAEDEEADGWGGLTESFHVGAFTARRWMESVSQS